MFAQQMSPDLAHMVGLAVCVATAWLIFLGNRMWRGMRRRRFSRPPIRPMRSMQNKRWQPSRKLSHRAPLSLHERVEQAWR
jgi:hypothetical protein